MSIEQHIFCFSQDMCLYLMLTQLLSLLSLSHIFELVALLGQLAFPTYLMAYNGNHSTFRHGADPNLSATDEEA